MKKYKVKYRSGKLNDLYWWWVCVDEKGIPFPTSQEKLAKEYNGEFNDAAKISLLTLLNYKRPKEWNITEIIAVYSEEPNQEDEKFNEEWDHA